MLAFALRGYFIDYRRFSKNKVQNKVQKKVQKKVQNIPTYTAISWLQTHSVITIQCCVRVYLSKLHTNVLRCEPEALFEEEFKEIRFDKLKMKGF